MLVLFSVLVFITTFVAVGLAVLIGWFTLQRLGAQAVAEDMPSYLSENETSALLRNDTLSTISIWAKVLERFDFVEILRRHLAQADLDWSVGRLTLLMLLTGSLVLALLMSLDFLPAWGALIAACGVASFPYLNVLRRRARRFRKFEEGFPDALESLARALRCGHPFSAAIEIVAAECEAPVSTELRKASVEANLGASWDASLHKLCERVPLIEVNMFASAVQLQARAGGKLNEVLGKLAENMRESVSLKGEIRALAAHGRLTGLVLTMLPIAIGGIMLFVNPSYLAVLIAHPYGKYLIAAAGVCVALAHFVIRRIVDIKA